MDITSALLYAVIAAATAIIYFVRRNLNYWKDRGIPQDEPHILWGNLRGFRSTRLLQEFFIETYQKYKKTGPFCGFHFAQKPMAFILDPKLTKDILIKHFSNFANRGLFYNEKDDPLTGHLFSLDGTKWRQLRHKLSPTFTSGKMKFMYPTVLKVGEHFVTVLSENVRKNNVIEIKDLCARYTTDVIGTCAFGIECNSLKNPNVEFREVGKLAFSKTRHGNMLMAFIASFPKLARKLRMRQIHEDVHQFFMRVVRETVAFREKSNIKRNDFMDLLIDLKNKPSSNSDDEDIMKGLTIEEVAAQAFVFFLAGFETSSTAMGYALYELARHQDIQDRMREEIVDTLAKHDQKLTYECIKDLKYMDQVFSETLRLYTIVPNLVREALEDFPVPGYPAKYTIPKGVTCLIPSSAMHLDPELYPEPYEFKPERFEPEAIAQRDSVEWLPFGDGPRNCIGMRFGTMQAKIGLALLLKNFKFSVCEKTQIPLKYDPKAFVLTSLGGIDLKVENVV